MYFWGLQNLTPHSLKAWKRQGIERVRLKEDIHLGWLEGEYIMV